MIKQRFSALALAIAVGVAMTVSPAAAQGKSKANKGQAADRSRVEQDAVRGGGIYDVITPARGNGAGKVPPGWCKGEGNPHRTVENCGYQATDRYEDRYPISDRYPTSDRYPNSGGDSYNREHDDFHRYLDRKYSDLAAQRPLDVTYQLRLRAEKAAEHERWHERTGIRH